MERFVQTIPAKHSILDVWQRSEYNSECVLQFNRRNEHSCNIITYVLRKILDAMTGFLLIDAVATGYSDKDIKSSSDKKLYW